MGDDDANYDAADANDYQSERYCKVYDHDDFFTMLVQIVLAVFALGSLYIKRLREVPRRTFRTWFLDVSKQGFGACYAHILNMMIASIISSNTRGTTTLPDQCAWYGISYLIDTTLGLLLAILFLQLLDNVANERDWMHLRHSGVYVGPDGLKHWFSQVMAWMLILTIVKLIIYIFMWSCSEPLAVVGAILFKPLQFNIRVELVFVMILFPGLLNVVYFWIADSFLQAKKEHTDAHENDETGLEDKKEGLLEMEEREGNVDLEQQSSSKPSWSIFGAQKQKQPQTVTML